MDIEHLHGAGLTEHEVQLVLEGRIPAPLWLPGDHVRVLENERNTPRVGSVRLLRWHHNQCQWMYYIGEGGRSICKRYWSADLESDD